MERLKQISEAVSQGKKVKIARYIKRANDKRLSEGTSDIIIDMNWKWDELQQKSLDKLNEMKNNEKVHTGLTKKLVELGEKDTNKIIKEAFDELTDSLIKSINTPYDPQKEKKEEYEYYSSNIKMNKKTGEIYFLGKLQLEIVTKEPRYKESKQRPKTVIKDAIRRQLPNYVKMFKLKTEEISKVKTL